MNPGCVSTSEPWAPENRTWSDEAFEETRDVFLQCVLDSHHQRGQAFALWALAMEPNLSDVEVPAYRGGCPESRPTPEDIARARAALASQPDGGGGAPIWVPNPIDASPKRRRKGKKAARRSRAKGKKLSQLEKSVLAELERAEQRIAALREAEADLERAREAVDAAKAALRELDPLERELIARHDESLADVLLELDAG